jgi:hypothetical protein
MNGDILNLALAAAGIVGGAVVSYYFYRISRKERRPIYAVTGNEVVRGDQKRQIEVRFKGEEVPVVTRTVVAFWNAGREPIRRDDIVGSHPPLVRRPRDAQLLEARVIATTRAEIDFECLPGGWYQHGLQLGFSFLNYQDGGAIEILHTGDGWLVDMDGAIVGVEGPPERFGSRREPLLLRPRTLVAILGALTLAVAILVSNKIVTGLVSVLLMLGLTLGILALSWFVFPSMLVPGPRDWRRVPKALREALGWNPPR